VGRPSRPFEERAVPVALIEGNHRRPLALAATNCMLHTWPLPGSKLLSNVYFEFVVLTATADIGPLARWPLLPAAEGSTPDGILIRRPHISYRAYTESLCRNGTGSIVQSFAICFVK
jgi:hypothetical protein